MLGNGKKNIGFDSNFYTCISGAVVYNPATITAAFKARVIAAGGAITATQESACLTLVTNLVNNNLWSKMKIIYPFVGGTSNSCKINLVDANYTATFSSGWTFTALGGTPNGANTFMLANGFNSSVQLTPYNTSWSYYSRTNNTSNGFELGVQNGFVNTDRIGMSIRFSGNNQSNMNDYNAGSGLIQNTATTSTGLYFQSRISTTSQQFFRNLTQLGATNTNTMTTPLPNATFTFATLSFNDGINYLSTNRQCAFAHAGTGLTSAEAATFYSNVQTFQTTLSRNV